MCVEERPKAREKHLRRGKKWTGVSPASKVIQIHLIKSLTLWSLSVGSLALKDEAQWPNTAPERLRLLTCGRLHSILSYCSFSHQTPHSYICSTLNHSITCGSPKYHLRFSSHSGPHTQARSWNILLPALYLTKLYSLGPILTDASFLILKDWVSVG